MRRSCRWCSRASSLLPERQAFHVGVREALACRGAGPVAPPQEGFTWLKPALKTDPAADPPVPVATDGFFVIDAEGYQLTAEAAGSSLKVVVTDDADRELQGVTKLLVEKQPGWYLFGWSASSPLEVGAKLRARLSAAPVSPDSASNVGGEFPLVVVGEPTALPEPDFDLSSWVVFYHGEEGPTLTCPLGAGGCGTSRTPNIPVPIDKQVLADVAWQVPPVTGGVAWRLRVESATSEPDGHVLNPSPTDYLGETSSGAFDVVGRIAFPTASAQHCASVVLEDLRTHEERRTEKCSPTQPSRRVESDTDLGTCREPPSETLREAWCQLAHALATPECEGVEGTGGPASGGAPSTSGSGGLSSTAGGGSGSGSTDMPPVSESGGATSGSGKSDASPESAPASRTSQSCQLGGPISPAGAAAGLLLALTLLARRRLEGRSS